jgi:hypothetical protein
MPKVSEVLFNCYLARHGYVFEAQPPILLGKRKQLDNRVVFEGAAVYFEVKEFEGELTLPPGITRGVFVEEGIDPYKPLFTKLKEAWAQLEDYKEFSGSVVLYNNSSKAIFLQPGIVLGAMLGPMAWHFDASGAENTVFSNPDGTGFKGSRMFDDKASEARYKHFSSVIVLESYAGEPRVSVYDNPFATIKLPEKMFRGPYDERWRVNDAGAIEQVYKGGLLPESKDEVVAYFREPRLIALCDR